MTIHYLINLFEFKKAVNQWRCIFVVYLLIAIPAYTQVMVFDHYDNKHGLNNEFITAIVQSKEGFIWVGTSFNVMIFDGLSFDKIPTDSIASSIHVQHLWVDEQNVLWIGTKRNGLLSYANHVLKKVSTQHQQITAVNSIKSGPNQQLWVGTDKGIFVVKDNALVHPSVDVLKDVKNKQINAIEFIDQQTMIIGVTGGFYVVNQHQQSLFFVPLRDGQQFRIHDLCFDQHGYLWIATSKKIFRFNLAAQVFAEVPDLHEASRILSIVEHQNHIWIASIDGGLFKVDTTNLDVSQYTHDKHFESSLKEKNATALFISNDNLLWVGSFSQGLSVLDLNLLPIAYKTNTRDSLYCAKDPKITSIEQDANGYLWLGSHYGLIKYRNKHCELITLDESFSQIEYTVYSTRHDRDMIWIASSIGLLNYDKNKKKITSFGENQVIFFTHEISDNRLLLGTNNGLFVFFKDSKHFDKLVISEPKYQNINFLKYTVHDNLIYLPTSQGLVVMNNNGELVNFEEFDQIFGNNNILNLQFDQNDELYVSVLNKGLYHLNKDHQLVKHYGNEYFSVSNPVYHILIDEKSNVMWLASVDGLMRLNKNSHEINLFSGTSQNKYFSLFNDAYKSTTGDLYFAGNSGIVSFKNQDLKYQSNDTEVILRDLHLMNDLVKFNNRTDTGFVLDKALYEVENLEFGYQDKVIKLDIAALNFSNPQSIKYQYKLLPTSTEWVSLTPGNRQLIFSDLKSGDYQLYLNSSNSDGSWSKKVRQLNFTINPAPWLSWQAYLFYSICLVLFVLFYIRHKAKKQKLINDYLNRQIDQKTEHIQQQKLALEDLMSRKNEIFSNVSHEFRTPITLILGPMAELQKDEHNPAKIEIIKMMTRNSKRLLRLVNQMLKLAHITEHTPHNKEVVNVASRLNMMIESYTHQARKNKIKLTVDKLLDVDVFVTEDALESTIGNFLSNAIKYTPEKGTINVAMRVYDQSVEVTVQDSGCGIEKKQQSKIFKRFNRMPNHQSYQGLGIGLALAKEVAEFNDATIGLDSNTGKGASFSITFPIHDTQISMYGDSSSPVAVTENQQPIDEKQTVLIIDDNQDMLTYLMTILSVNYHCLIANNGQKGIAIAIKQVPDIVVCDVMMPGIDGFQVCRRLRKEMITSHIPLVLLTAVDEKASRIKGWRENIDMYLNKPFDAQELNLQLLNILKIRTILQNSIKKDLNENTTTVHLSAVDQTFIDQLNNTTEKSFTDPGFDVEKMSQTLYVTPKQLQRKTKALLNLSPSQFLKEYRMKKVAELLKNGYQVSLISDTCGFSSISSLSRAFKQYYGLTPKEYQKLNKLYKDK